MKLELSEDFAAQNGDLDCKIFTLLPENVKTVRAVKNYLSQKLKLTNPFNFYNGDYKILDAEDARIFTLTDQPFK